MKDLNTTSLNKISRDISGPPDRKSTRDLSTGTLYLTGPIQDLLISLDLLGPFTGALYKISSQDLYERSLHKSSRQGLFTRPPCLTSLYKISCKISSRDPYQRSLWEISITGAPYKISSQDLYQARPLWNVSALYKISSQNLCERSLPKSSLQDLFGLFTGALYKISSQDLYERFLQKSSLQDLFTRPLWESLQDLFARPLWEIQDLFTRPLWEISIQELSTKRLHKPHMRRRYARSPDIPGPPRSLHRSSLQDLFTRHLWKISIQELSKISWYPWTAEVSSQQLSTRFLHKTYIWEIFIQELSTRSLHKSSLQDLFTRLLWEISLQELSTRSLHRTPIRDISMQDLRKSLDRLGLFTAALYKIFSQDLYMRGL